MSWLYEKTDEPKRLETYMNRSPLIHEASKTNSKKIIDSRTFTRPKKRISRPSIETYNEGYFNMDKYLNSELSSDSNVETQLEDFNCYSQSQGNWINVY